MDKKFAALAILFSLGACTQQAANSNAAAGDNATAPAAQAAIPDLKGTWSGTSESIVTGNALHHAAQSGNEPLLDNILFTYVIAGQDGHRFWGKVSSAHGEEPLMGVISKDGKSILARDSDGEIRGTLTDADTIEMTYDHRNPSSTVVALNTIKRQK